MAAVVAAVILMIALRCIALDSDAYPRLSWSSALLTDEGFYIHNARNTVLFGHARTDGFNNALIMPLLNAAQILLFRLAGVGAVQARSLSVALGLLTLPVFYDAMRRAFGRRAGLAALVLLGLDHVSLLYSRLALMDTPAAFVLVCGFWLWVRSAESEAGRARCVWLFLCGLVLGGCYGVRGLGALVYPVPVWLLLRDAFQKRRAGQGMPMGSLFCLLGGLALALGLYALLWAVPNRAELARVNHYYLLQQLAPHSVEAVRQNITVALFGDARGYASYLVRHTPVPFALAILGITAGILRRGRHGLRPRARAAAHYLCLWLLAAWALFGSVRYAPPRYYVLFYPAMMGMAALTLVRIGPVLRTVWRHRGVRSALGAFLTYHVCEAALHHASPWSDTVLYSGTAGAALLLWRAPPAIHAAGRQRRANRAAGLMAGWAVVNALWLGDWLGHLRWAQRDADRWMAANLPQRSVLVGDAAPGLARDSRFISAAVIPGLCNDVRPLETFAGVPRYVVILSGERNVNWWRSRYPDIIRPERLLRRMQGLINFEVEIYMVPAEAARSSGRPLARHGAELDRGESY